jgi:hypothetical protein
MYLKPSKPMRLVINSKTKFTLENNGAGEYRPALNQQTTEGTKK